MQECLEVVAFDVSMEQWLNEFVESIIASETRGIAAQQVTYESVEAFSAEEVESTMAQCIR